MGSQCKTVFLGRKYKLSKGPSSQLRKSQQEAIAGSRRQQIQVRLAQAFNTGSLFTATN